MDRDFERVVNHISDFVQFSYHLVKNGIEDEMVKQTLLKRWSSRIEKAMIMKANSVKLITEIEYMVWSGKVNGLTLDLVTYCANTTAEEIKAALKARQLELATEPLAGPSILNLSFFQNWFNSFTERLISPLSSHSTSEAQRLTRLFKRMLLEGATMGLSAEDSFEAYIQELLNTDDNMAKPAEYKIEEVRKGPRELYLATHCLIVNGLRSAQAQKFVLERFDARITGLPFADSKDELIAKIIVELRQFVWEQGPANVVEYLKCIHRDIAAEAQELQKRITPADEPVLEEETEAQQHYLAIPPELIQILLDSQKK